MTSLKALHRDVLATAQRLFFDLLQAVGPCQPAASGSITLLVDGPQEGSNPNRRPSITTRHINSENKHWLRREARRVGASTEELVGRPKPSEAFARHFGEKHGVELPTPARCGYRPLSFSSEDEERPLPSQRGNRRKTP